MSQWELEANTGNLRQARENASDQVAIGFGFASDWSSQSVVKQNQSIIPDYFRHSIETRSICGGIHKVKHQGEGRVGRAQELLKTKLKTEGCN